MEFKKNGLKKIKLKVLSTVTHTRQFFKISCFESPIQSQRIQNSFTFKISTFNSMAKVVLKYTLSFHI